MKTDQHGSVEVMDGEQEKGSVKRAISETGGDRILEGDGHPPVKLDRYGLPLVPQPTDRKDDPLVGEAASHLYRAVSRVLLLATFD